MWTYHQDSGRLRYRTTYAQAPYNFLAHQEVVTRQNGYHIPNFTATGETPQGGLISLTLLNVVVDNVVHMWMIMTVEDQAVVQECLGLNGGRCMVVFYANDDMIRGRN